MSDLATLATLHLNHGFVAAGVYLDMLSQRLTPPSQLGELTPAQHAGSMRNELNAMD